MPVCTTRFNDYDLVNNCSFKAEAPGRCIFDLDDGSLSTGIHMPPLPLEQEIRDQVTACFNRLRAEKFESDKKNVFAQFSLHGEDQASSAAVIADKTHEENVALARPFRIAFGLVFCGYESFIVNSAEQKKNTLNFDKVSFLSEQPDYHVDFLAAFLETQSFASFIDEKINARQVCFYMCFYFADSRNECIQLFTIHFVLVTFKIGFTSAGNIFAIVSFLFFIFVFCCNIFKLI